MKITLKIQTFFYIAFLTLLFALNISASLLNSQNSSWVRIESESKDLSINLPPGFFVDAGKKDSDQIICIYGFQNGVLIQIKVFDESNPKQRLERISPIQNRLFATFDKEKFSGRVIYSKDSDTEFYRSVHLASKKTFYNIRIESPDKTAPEISKFLSSVLINGKQLFDSLPAGKSVPDVVSIKDLKTSPEIEQLLQQKIEKNNISSEVKKLSELPMNAVPAKLFRPVIIVDNPRPTFRPNFSMGFPPSQDYLAKLQVSFLADGRIGAVTAYSNSDQRFIKACIEAARKIKFIPAQINGKNVDAVEVVDYDMSIRLMAIPGRIISASPILF